MANCPQCNSVLNMKDDDFGMIPCSSCGAMVFVDMSGEVEIYTEEEVTDEIGAVVDDFGGGVPEAELADDFADSAEHTPESEAGEEYFEEPGDVAEPLVEDHNFELTTEAHEESDWSNSEPAVHETEEPFQEPFLEEQNSQTDLEHEQELSPIAEFEDQPVSEEATDDVAFEDGFDLDTPLVDETTEDEPTSAIDPLAEIESFGNEELQATGAFAYNVVIEGIDTAEMRRWVNDSLDDERFYWRIEELMDAIEGGRLELAGLNPVKASLVVSRLKNLKIKISWTQHSVHELAEEVDDAPEYEEV